MTESTRPRSCHGSHCSHSTREAQGLRAARRVAGPGALLLAGVTAFGVFVAVFAGPARPQLEEAHAASQGPGSPHALGVLLAPGAAPASVGRPSVPVVPGTPEPGAAEPRAGKAQAAKAQADTTYAVAPRAAVPGPGTEAPAQAAKDGTGAKQQVRSAALRAGADHTVTRAPAAASKHATRAAAAKRTATARQVAAATGKKRIVRLGNDVSWPQCGSHGLRMPRKSKHFVVIGLTGGRAFRRNPCVKAQVDWAKRNDFHAGAYAMTTFPTKKQLRRNGTKGPFAAKGRTGKLRNAGYQAARFDLATLRHADFAAKHIWIDVEPHPSRPWTKNRKANKAVIDGVVRGYRDAGLTVGFYSTKALWRNIVGSARYHAPEWRTAGPTSDKKAARMCSRGGFQGGNPVLAQWWTRTVDHNRTCGGAGRPEAMARYFVKY